MSGQKTKQLLLCIITFSFMLAFSLVCYASQDELEEIKKAIDSKGARWYAEETSVSELPDSERKMRLGAMASAEPAGETTSVPRLSSASAVPASLDWRNYNGYNYVTPVRDQGNCGSCWAFATTAALESNILITGGGSTDLSEQVMISCSGSGSCSGGGIAAEFIKYTGLPDESYYPYGSTNGQCSNALPGWQNNTFRISGFVIINEANGATVDIIKEGLTTFGPLVTSFSVYTDFFYYAGGVYEHTYGSYEDGHFILIVGYDDPGQYFIAKNSWGPDWGESGYFRIGYSQLSGVVKFGNLGTIAYYIMPSISGNITSNMTLGPAGSPAATEYLLSGTVYVKAPAELTIQPGTKIYGDRTGVYGDIVFTSGRLVVERGAKIHAVGTPTQPIVFTSTGVMLEQTPARGDWGGVIIAGNAPVNVPGGAGSYLGVPYGGSDPNDNSGEIRYVRVEYAGSADFAGKGLSFYGVGSGTAVDHVEVYMGGGDCIEMFGGTVNLKYMVGAWCGSDSLYWSEGWTGKAQFIIGSQRADQPGSGTGAYNNISGHDNFPRSNPLIYNMTMVGDPYTTWGTASARGMALMSGSAGRIYNSIFTGFKLQGVAVDDVATVTQGTSGNLVVGNGIVFGNNSGGAQYDTDAQNLINTGRWTNLQTVDPGLCNPLPDDIYAYIDASKKYMPNFAPASGSPAINGTVPVATPPADGFFTAVNFIGAVDPTNDWTYGWTTFGAAKQKAGDLNYDGSVSVLDVVKVKRIASSASPYQSCSDLNNDGSVSVLDVVKVKRRASGADSPTVCCTE